MPHPNIPGGYKSEEERQKAMAIPPQFLKGAGTKKQDPKAEAKKKVAAARLAKLKGKKAPMVADTDRDGN